MSTAYTETYKGYIIYFSRKPETKDAVTSWIEIHDEEGHLCHSVWNITNAREEAHLWIDKHPVDYSIPYHLRGTVKYLGFRTDYDDHCQRCDKRTNRLHWYQLNPQQVATFCEDCKPEADKIYGLAKERPEHNKIYGSPICESDFMHYFATGNYRIQKDNWNCLLCGKPCNRIVMRGDKTINWIHEECQIEYNKKIDEEVKR